MELWNHFRKRVPPEAGMKYNQNGLVLPKESRHLEILLSDKHEKGFLDLECPIRSNRGRS
jgi:hypothetical protein